jgi:hypothetical protein
MYTTLSEKPACADTAVMSDCLAQVVATRPRFAVASQPLTVTATCAARSGLHTDLLALLSPYVDRGSELIDLRSREFEAPMDSMMIFEATVSVRMRDGRAGTDTSGLLASIEALEPDMILTVSYAT